MIKVEINILPVSDKSVGEATLVIRKKRHGNWETLRTITVIAGSELAKRVLLLDDGEQLLVDGNAKQELVYDRDQNVATLRDMVE